MIRRPPRSTLDRSSAASDVYKRQDLEEVVGQQQAAALVAVEQVVPAGNPEVLHLRVSVSYTHLRAHETVLDIVCRLLLEKKKKTNKRYTANRRQ